MSKNKVNYAFSGDEIATILHALRMLQDGGRIADCAIGACDHFDGWKELTKKQIDKLCERINPLDTEAEPDKTTQYLREAIFRFRKACDGDSGDAEHDAAVTVADLAESLLPSNQRRAL